MDCTVVVSNADSLHRLSPIAKPLWKLWWTDRPSSFSVSRSTVKLQNCYLDTRKGSDSAPHPIESKKKPSCAAGCFTQGWTTTLIITALEEGLNQGWIREDDVTREAIEGFLSKNGRAFYGLSNSEESGSSKPKIRLERRGERIPKTIASQDGSIEVVPFRAGEEILSVSWQQ